MVVEPCVAAEGCPFIPPRAMEQPLAHLRMTVSRRESGRVAPLGSVDAFDDDVQ
jgi:hypothetical protein